VSGRRIKAPRVPFTKRERALIARLNTPAKVQRWLNALQYNTEQGGETQRSFRPVVRSRTAHCMEAALFAAVDYTGRLKGFGVANLADAMGGYDWRLTTKNVWKVEQMLIDLPHRKISSSIRRYRVLLKKYRAYRAAHDDRKPTQYRGKDKWEPLPGEFRK
jgi:hypothetical protein